MRKEYGSFSVISGSLTTIITIIAGITSILKITIPSLIFGFLLVPCFISLMACIHFNSAKGKLYSMLGIVFAAIYGILISFNYFLQLTLMQKSIPGLELFSMSNPDSIMWVVEVLGYFFMGLSTLSMIPAMGSSSSIEKVVKSMLLLNGILGIGGLVGYALGWNLNLLLIGLLVWNIALPTGTGFLTYYYIKTLRG